MEAELPWADYTRDVLSAGVKYQLRQAEIADALRAANLRVDHVDLIRPVTLVQRAGRFELPPGGLYVISGTIHGNTLPHGGVGGINGSHTTSLGISALPTSVELAPEALVGELDFAVLWMKHGLARGNAWLASGRSVHCLLESNGRFRRVEEPA